MELLNQGDRKIIESFMDNAEAFISNLPFKVEPLLSHKFYPGVYIREMILPFAGIQIISKIHKTEHAFMVSMGRILVYDGIHEAVIVKAPFTGRSMPGDQRIGISLEPVKWSNIHPTKIKPATDSNEDLEIALMLIERQVIKSEHKKTITMGKELTS